MWNCILFSPDGWSGERQPWMAGAATRFRGSYNRRPWELQPKRELQPWMAGSCNRASGGAACGERLDGGVLFLLQPLYSFLRPSRILATSFFHRGPAGSTAISGGWGWLASTGSTGLTDRSFGWARIWNPVCSSKDSAVAAASSRWICVLELCRCDNVCSSVEGAHEELSARHREASCHGSAR
nr:uncharacterized protein LOC109758358 [Aegilops tauschii subsp. strangulata]